MRRDSNLILTELFREQYSFVSSRYVTISRTAIKVVESSIHSDKCMVVKEDRLFVVPCSAVMLLIAAS